MALFENVKDNLENGHTIIARLGRVGKSDVNWREPKEYPLFIQKSKGKIILLAPSDSWAEYCPQYDYCGKNLFQNEDYYMEVLDWMM